MKVFYIEFASPHWLNFASRAAALHGIQPLVWTAMRNMREETAGRFPDAHFLDLADVKRNVPPPQFAALSHAGFDRHCENVWRNLAQLVYDQYHRWDRSGDFDTLQRTEHFYETVIFWNALLEQLRPDAVLFRNAPHAIYDLVLLALARSRGVATVMFHHSNLSPYSIVSADVVESRNPFREGLRFSTWERQAGHVVRQETLTPQTRATLELMRKSYAEAAPYYQLPSMRALKESFSWRRMRKAALMLWHAFRRDLRDCVVGRLPHERSPINTGSMAKQHGRLLRESYFGPFARTSYTIQRIREMRINLSYKEHYNQLSQRLGDAPPQPFIYYPLSFQPETTSNPQGGIFAQQVLSTNLLANSLPPGWKLIVREHPAQFNPDYVGQVCRNKEFYRLIAAIPNVILAPLDLDPFWLIDRSSAIATLVGTTGWEAVVRGKPVLVFGDTWYDRCPGVFRVRTLDQCQAALRQIAAGITLDSDELTAFIKELDYSGIAAGHELEVTGPEVVTTPAQLDRMIDMVADVIGLPPRQMPVVPLRSMLLNESGKPDAPPTTQTTMKLDWNTPLEELPENIDFNDLPPLVQALVRRNLWLRQELENARSTSEHKEAATSSAAP